MEGNSGERPYPRSKRLIMDYGATEKRAPVIYCPGPVRAGEYPGPAAVKEPRVMVGGPIRDRGWIAPDWVTALLGQDYPHLRIVALVNDSQDDTEEILRWYAAQYPGRIEVVRQDFGCTVDNNNRCKGERDYRQFTDVRNAWLDCRQEEDYVWFVDSDIICPPTTLSRLLAHRKHLVAAMIDNDSMPTGWHTNGLRWWDPHLGPEGFYYWPVDLIEERGLVEVDLTGACFLIHRAVLDRGCRYHYHEYGEDCTFCWQAHILGYRIWIDGSIRADHRMRRPKYDGRESRFFRENMARYWAWRLDHEIAGTDSGEFGVGTLSSVAETVAGSH